MAGCLEVRASAHGGIGNQLLYIMSVAVLVDHSWGPSAYPTCSVRLDRFRYGDSGTQRLTAALDLAAAAQPCNIIQPGDPWLSNDTALANQVTYDRSTKKDTLSSRSWTRQQIQTLCSKTQALHLDHYYNFCGAAGLVKPSDLAPRDFWERLYARGANLRKVVQDVSSTSYMPVIDNSTLCIHIRARTVEPVSVNAPIGGEVISVPRCLRATGRRHGVCKGLRDPLEPARRTMHQALRLASQKHVQFSSLFLASPINVDIPSGLRHLELRSSSLHAGFTGGNAEVSAAVSDALALSQCQVVVAEDPPLKTTFGLLVMLLGGHTPCVGHSGAVILVRNPSLCNTLMGPASEPWLHEECPPAPKPHRHPEPHQAASAALAVGKQVFARTAAIFPSKTLANRRQTKRRNRLAA